MKIRLITLLMAVSMVLSMLAGCGSNQTQSDTANTTSTEASASNSAQASATEPVTLTFFTDATIAASENTKTSIEAFTKETGIQVKANVVPGNGDESTKKIDIDLMSGDATDIINMTSSNMTTKYVKAGIIIPLDDLAAEVGYDPTKVFGKYLEKQADGKLYYYPCEISESCVFYNKKVFDDAKVPYPTAPWTWDQYMETAKKLTNKDKGIYGSLMQDYDYYFYNLAQQRGISGYKSDGTSNFDDSAFADSMKWYRSFGDAGVQQSWLEYHSKKIPWDAFMSGNYGMIYVGSWHLSLFGDEKYPRDWKFGIAASPANEDGKNVLSAGGSYGINANSKHPKEAFQFVKWMSENRYKYYGAFPAREDITAEQFSKDFEEYCKTSLKGDVTTDDLFKALNDNGLGIVPEKIVGAASSQINDMIIKEGESFMLGRKSVEETLKVIKQKADAFIKQDSTAK